MKQLANDITKAILKDLMIVWRQLMASDYAINVKSNTTLEFSNLDNTAKIEATDFHFNLFYNHYLEYIESGRKPKTRKVPIRPLIDWMKRKHISDDNRVAYAIRESIYQLGIPPRPLLEPFGEMLDERFEKKIYDDIYNKITEKLDLYFNS